MDKLITILIPCRERHAETRRLLQSIQDKTRDHSRVAVITITDFDRPEDANNIQDFMLNGSIPGLSGRRPSNYAPHTPTIIDFELYNICRSRSPNLNRDYYNLANLLSESYFSWILGNDCDIVTDGWDQNLYNATAPYIDDIKHDRKYVYVHIDDNTHVKDKFIEEGGNCFPIVSQNFSRKIRGPMPEGCNSWGGDTWLWRGFRELPNTAYVNCTGDPAIEIHPSTGRVTYLTIGEGRRPGEVTAFPEITPGILITHKSTHSGSQDELDNVGKQVQANAIYACDCQMDLDALSERWNNKFRVTQNPLIT